MDCLFNLVNLALVSRVSAYIGSFLIGPATIGLLYGFMFSDNPGSRLDCASVEWHIGYDMKDGCSVDIAQRMRCGSGGASCFSLDKGYFGGSPPALDAMVDGWVYAGTLVIGTGVLHLFVAHLLQGILTRNIWMILTSYLSVICFFAVVGTSSSGGNKLLQNLNFASHSLLYMLFCTTNTTMLRNHLSVWSSQLAYVLHSINILTLMFVLASFSFVAAAFGQQKPCSTQYMASGVLSISQQLFLTVYSILVLVMFNNSASLDETAWQRLSSPPGRSIEIAQEITGCLVYEEELFIGKRAATPSFPTAPSVYPPDSLHGPPGE